MSKLMTALLVAAGLCMAGSAAAQTYASNTSAMPTPMTKDNLALAKKHAEAQLKTEKAACGSLSGNAKDICVAQADGREKVAKADAEAAYENTAKAREAARVARAEANYNVVIQKCDDLAGNPKDVCVKEAKSELVKGKADAKVDRVAADTSKEAATKQADARQDANADKREAQYQVAIQKCDALAGPTKDTCVGNAKVQFGKS
jgi:hypothetical protein